MKIKEENPEAGDEAFFFDGWDFVPVAQEEEGPVRRKPGDPPPPRA